MNVTWLGCAGFRLEARGDSILLDPYLSRNPEARPVQDLTPQDLAPASHILISHGHFDHLMDVPAIARVTGATAVCDPIAARTLIRMGLGPEQIRIIRAEGEIVSAGPFTARAAYSAHVRFDLKLMAETLARAGKKLPGMFPLFARFPCGQVLSWRIRAGDLSLQFFGSAGSGKKELARLGARRTDLALIPLQGHSGICGIGLEYLRAIRPALAIPHHFDDFYPPLSKPIDIDPFVRGVDAIPGTRVKIPEINETIVV